MKAILDLSVRAKLLLVLGSLLVIFAISITVAYSSILGLLAAQQDVRMKQINETDFARVLANHNEARVAGLMLISGSDRAEFPRWTERINKAHDENSKLLARLAVRADVRMLARGGGIKFGDSGTRLSPSVFAGLVIGQ